MRSVFLYLRDVDEKAVGIFLRQICPGQESPWIVRVDDDPCLYIDFYTNARQESDANEWRALAEALGGETTVSLYVGISGRHAGDQQVKEFVSAVLNKFHGVAK
ncbi:MAG TPA: hypothetical protein VHM88_10045, partial [Candidatus Acidoferrales bacterium]|nr:hypothetical protein [Candidatus Acidoferrales bacterium]